MSQGSFGRTVVAAPARCLSRVGRPAAVMVGGLLLSGCALGPAQPHGLHAQPSMSPPVQIQRQDMIRRLAAQCYWHHEGERLVFGPQSVYLACREWADRRTRVHVPPRLF